MTFASAWLDNKCTAKAYRQGIKAGLQAADLKGESSNPYQHVLCVKAWNDGYTDGFSLLKEIAKL